MTQNADKIQKIQRWARKIAWREDWKKKLLEQGNMPLGVDSATVNYIRNVMMTMDDKSLKEWIRQLATTQERLDNQNSDFFAWVKTNQAQPEAPETADASKAPLELLAETLILGGQKTLLFMNKSVLLGAKTRF